VSSSGWQKSRWNIDKNGKRRGSPWLKDAVYTEDDKKARPSNSRSGRKILCDLCRKPLWEPFKALLLAVVTTRMASIDASPGTQPLLAFVEAELRHGHGIPKEAVAPEG
jgi:hypothetical protein